jgi:hypothetical protein
MFCAGVVLHWPARRLAFAGDGSQRIDVDQRQQPVGHLAGRYYLWVSAADKSSTAKGWDWRLFLEALYRTYHHHQIG